MAPPALLLPSSFADPPIILRLSFGPLEGNPVISIIPTEGSPNDDGRQKLPGCRDVWPRRDRVGRLAGFALQPVRRQRSDVAGARRPGRDLRDPPRRRPPGPTQAARAWAAARRRRQKASPRTAAPAQAA